jgi:hypothetical protein
MLFDLKGIFPHKIFLDVFHGTGQRFFLIFKRRLTDTVDALVGVNLDEDPVGAEAVDREELYVSDFHVMLPPLGDVVMISLIAVCFGHLTVRLGDLEGQGTLSCRLQVGQSRPEAYGL